MKLLTLALYLVSTIAAAQQPPSAEFMTGIARAAIKQREAIANHGLDEAGAAADTIAKLQAELAAAKAQCKSVEPEKK